MTTMMPTTATQMSMLPQVGDGGVKMADDRRRALRVGEARDDNALGQRGRRCRAASGRRWRRARRP